MTIEHEFLAPGDVVRCVHCGTKRGHHKMVAQPCVPRWGEGEALRPEPARRECAVDDSATISARLVELDAAMREMLNRPEET